MMKEKINLMYNGNVLDCRWNGVDSYILPNGNFTYLNEQNEVINSKEFNVVNLIYDGELVKFVYNPISNNYWFCNSHGIPWIMPKNIYQPVKCDKLKYIVFPIPKNGCSCLVKSALFYDGHISPEYTESNEFIWGRADLTSKIRMAVVTRENFVERYKDYKKFIVLQPENERFIRFLNWSHKHRYNKFYNFNLSLNESRREHEWSLPLVTSNPFCCDEHAVTQDTHVKMYIDLFFNGDKEAFDENVEVVQLSELPEWFEKTFGEKMIMNNIEKPEDWLYKF